VSGRYETLTDSNLGKENSFRYNYCVALNDNNYNVAKSSQSTNEALSLPDSPHG